MNKEKTKKRFKLVGAVSFAVTFAVVTLGGYLFNCVKASNEMQIEKANQTQTEQSQNKNESRQTNSNISINGFDPVNDPVLFETNSGIKIRFHNTSITTSEGIVVNNDLETTSGLAGYPYITTYSDENNDGVEEPYNWVIIGYNNGYVEKTNEKQKDPLYVSEVDSSFIEFLQGMDTTSPAGRAIAQDGGIFNAYGKFNYSVGYHPQDFANFSNPVVNNEELGIGEVLCLSEYCLGTAYFDKNNITPKYSQTDNIEGNMLYWMEHCYTKENNVVTSSKFGLGTLPLQYKNLITGNDFMHNTGQRDKPYSSYVFPLATKYGENGNYLDSKQNFCIEYYLNDDNGTLKNENYSKQCGYDYSSHTLKDFWLRSMAWTKYSYIIRSSIGGCVWNWGIGTMYYSVCGMRPAFVLSLL